MKSLSELNTRSANSFEFSDTRNATVVFDRVPTLYDLDRLVDFSVDGTTVTVTPNIEIQEIVNYTTANVELIVTMQDFTGSPSVNWSDLTDNLSVDEDSGTYTVSGFQNVADWESARSFSLTHSSYATDTLFWLDVSISYYDEELDVTRTVDWIVYDPDHYWLSQMETAVTVETIGNKVRFGEANLLAIFDVGEFGSDMIMTATLNADVNEIVQLESDLDVVATVNAVPQRTLGPLVATTISASATLSCSPVVITLDFSLTDTQSTNTDTIGSIGMSSNYVVTAYTVSGPGISLYEISPVGNISYDSGFTISSADENNGYIPFNIKSLELQLQGSYRYLFQHNEADIGSSKTTSSARLWRDVGGSGNFSKVFELLGTTTTNYFSGKYYLSNSGNHYIAVAEGTSTDGGSNFENYDWKIYRSTNGTSWTYLYSISPVGLSDNAEQIAFNDDYFIIAGNNVTFYDVDSGSFVHSWDPGSTLTGNVSAYGNIIVSAGTDGHRIYDISSFTVLDSKFYSSDPRQTIQTNGYVAIRSTTNTRIYKTFGTYGLQTTIATGTDCGLSLYGLALRSTTDIKLYR